jgi:O-antigen ligase
MIYPWLDLIPWTQSALLGSLAAFLLEKQSRWQSSTQSKLLVLYLLTVVASILLGYDPAAGWANFDLIASWLLVHLMIVNVTTTRTRFALLFLLFLLASFKMSQHGFLSWARRGFQFANWGVTGSPGWFHNSGEFGIQLAVFIPLSVTFLAASWRHWNWVKRLFFLAMPVTAVGALIATSSRASQLACLIVAIYLGVSASRSRMRAALVLVAVLAIVWYFMPATQLNRIAAIGTDATSVQRLVYWRHGLDMLSSHPLLGVGYFSWIPYYTDHWPDDVPYQGVEMPHNIFVQAAAETGLLGLGLYVAMIVYCFAMHWSIRRHSVASKDRETELLSRGLDGALIGFLISASFVSVLYYPYFWIHAALATSLYNVVRREAAAADCSKRGLTDRPRGKFGRTGS